VRPLLGSLRRLILGETWTIPLGVGASLGLAVLIRASLPEASWEVVGGFCLAAFVLGVLACSLRGAPRSRR
jgi:hypothetical protein